MANDIMKLQNTVLSNLALLRVLPDDWADWTLSSEVVKASSSFFHLASMLPEGEFLGWQVSADREGRPSCLAFSSEGAEVDIKDYRWAFGSCATVEAPVPDAGDSFRQDGRRVYAILSSAHQNADSPDSGADSSACLKELMPMMAESGAVLRILAKSDGSGSSGQAEILLSLPERIPLRMRYILSNVFPGSVLRELDREADPLDAAEPFPAMYAERRMSEFLPILMQIAWEEMRAQVPVDDKDEKELVLVDDVYENYYDEDELAEPEEDEAESADGKKADEDDSLPIEEMELSIRSYNCLKRAGINTVGQVRQMTDEDFMRVRNLGRKSMEEIKQVLLTAPWRCRTAAVALTAKSYSAMLGELIGLGNAKEQIRKLTAFAKLKQARNRQGEKPIPVALNMEFVGNPGTAKTTVARIVAGIFHEVGLLTENGLMEVGRADLVAKYEGQTADKVKNVFQQARGKVLFIDEAYSLVENWEEAFGDEAISTIVQEMENNRDDTVVIFAGYPDKMEQFFDRNPGLRSRVPFKISFDDYSVDEMVQIVELEAKKRGFSVQPEARERVSTLCKEALGRKNAGNGRFCRNLVESAVLDYAARVYGEDAESLATDCALTSEDFSAAALPQKAKKTPAMGFRTA